MFDSKFEIQNLKFPVRSTGR